MNKKILGYFSIGLMILLALPFFAAMPKIIDTIIQFLKIFTGDLSSEQAGEATGGLVYWAIHITVMFFLWKYGTKWIKTKPKLNGNTVNNNETTR